MNSVVKNVLFSAYNYFYESKNEVQLDLPNEIWCSIMGTLDAHSLASVSRVSHRFNSFVKTDKLWTLLVVPSVIVESRNIRWYKDQACTIICQQLSPENKVVFKVIRDRKNPGCAFIQYTGAKSWKKFKAKAQHVPIDDRLVNYMERLIQGEYCGIYNQEREEHSNIIELGV